MASPPNGVWETSVEILYWWRVTTPDLSSASDWSCRVGNWIRPIRSTTQIWVMSVISMEFLRLFLRRHWAGKPLIASPNVGCFLKLGTLNSLQSTVYNNSYLVVYFSTVFIKGLAPCNKGIRFPESGQFLLVESGILYFAMRNTAQGIRNPTNDSNLQFRFHWQRLESCSWIGIQAVKSRIQECVGFP